MADLKIEKYALGIYMANCYVLWKEKHVLIIDPGSTSRKLLQHLKDSNAIVDGILLTHGHFDHIGGVDYFASEFKCPVFIDEEDKEFLTNTYLNCSLPGKDCIVKSKINTLSPFKNKVGEFEFETISAPGHTNGCTMFKFENHLFSGDVLFKESIGRCDLPKGSNHKMMDSIQMIKSFDSNIIVYPGHGETTTIDYELKYNPFF